MFDYASRYGEAQIELAQWLKEGKLKRRFHIEQGLENCPKHLNGLFTGVNTGKMYGYMFRPAFYLSTDLFASTIGWYKSLPWSPADCNFYTLVIWPSQNRTFDVDLF